MGKEKVKKYVIRSFSRYRRLAADVLRLSKSNRVIRALIEVDISGVHAFLKASRSQCGMTPSLTAFLLTAIAHAVDENKILHAQRTIWGKLIIYDDVDIITYIELGEEEKFPFGLIIRGANHKSICQIHQEIEDFKQNPQPKWETGVVNKFILLPRFLRRWLLRLAYRSPALTKRYRGTVGVTAVGMFGTGTGWGLGAPSHTLGITIGGIGQKLSLENNQVVTREILNLTIDCDHTIIDGAPLARFVRKLRRIIENNYTEIPLTAESNPNR